jgi:hypothetical protein
MAASTRVAPRSRRRPTEGEECLDAERPTRGRGPDSLMESYIGDLIAVLDELGLGREALFIPNPPARRDKRSSDQRPGRLYCPTRRRFFSLALR